MAEKDRSRTSARQLNQMSRAARMFAVHYLEDVRKAAREVGYAITVHGTMDRDVDLVAIPWVEEAGSPMDLIKAIIEVVPNGFLSTRGSEMEETEQIPRPHGRLGWVIWFGGMKGTYIDLSVMPRKQVIKRVQCPKEGCTMMRASIESCMAEDCPSLLDLKGDHRG